MSILQGEIGDRNEILLEDLIECAFILRGVLNDNKDSPITKTAFSKIIANYLLDQKAKKFIKWEPHPFGAIAVIPAKDGIRFNQDIYLFSDAISELKLWKYEKKGSRGFFTMSEAQKSAAEEWIQDYERKYMLRGYSQLYGGFSTIELNQLASCRHEGLAYWCTEYEENLAVGKLVKVFNNIYNNFDYSGIEKNSGAKSNLKKDITSAAVASAQISTKLDMYMNNRVIKEKVLKIVNSTGNSLANKLYNEIEVNELSNRLLRLGNRGIMLRSLVSILRLVFSAFQIIKEEPRLIRIDSIGQYRLFNEYLDPIYSRAIRLGKELKVPSYIQNAKNIVNNAEKGLFRDAIKCIRDELFIPIDTIIKEDPEKAGAYKRSAFTVVDKISIFDFSAEI